MTKWRQGRYELYATLTKKPLLGDFEKSFLALARLGYEQRRFDSIGSKDLENFDQIFEEVYKPILFENIVQISHQYNSYEKMPSDFLKRFEIDQSDINFKAANYVSDPQPIHDLLVKEAQVLGLPAPTFLEILDTYPQDNPMQTPFIQFRMQCPLGKKIVDQALAQKLSQKIKNLAEGLLDLKQKLKEEMTKWQQSVGAFLKEQSQEIDKLRKRFPIHQALMKMFSFNPKDKEWNPKFEAFTKILTSKKVAQKDDRGQTIWHLFVAETQRPEFQDSPQVKILKDLLFESPSFKKEFALIKDKDGNTPLHLAIEFGDLDLTQRLFKAASQEIWKVKNRDGLTPLGLAFYNFSINHQPKMVHLIFDQLQNVSLKERVLILNDKDTTGTEPWGYLDEKNIDKAVALGAMGEDLAEKEPEPQHIQSEVKDKEKPGEDEKVHETDVLSSQSSFKEDVTYTIYMDGKPIDVESQTYQNIKEALKHHDLQPAGQYPNDSLIPSMTLEVKRNGSLCKTFIIDSKEIKITIPENPPSECDDFQEQIKHFLEKDKTQDP